MLNQVAKIYENEIGDQESAFYVLQAAFKRDYSHDQTANELERLATATEPLAGAARRVHATASTSSSARTAARPRTCG